MSTLDRISAAAHVAQPLHAGDTGATLFPVFSDDLRRGAHNFVLMLARVYGISEETVLRFGDDVDGRDYKAMAFEIETAILANLLGSGKDVREGFLRAMTDCLSCAVDGVGRYLGGSGEEALTVTAAAYAGHPSAEVSHG